MFAAMKIAVTRAIHFHLKTTLNTKTRSRLLGGYSFTPNRWLEKIGV